MKIKNIPDGISLNNPIIGLINSDLEECEQMRIWKEECERIGKRRFV